MLNALNEIIWGTPLLILLLGTGLLYTIRLRAFQLIHFPYIIKNTLINLLRGSKEKKCREKGSISQLRAVSASLAAAMGTGNIAGVATAVTIGGPGAIFWMWISALLGMTLVYAENFLGTLYRKRENKKWLGGPMAYLEHGVGSRKLAAFFALCCAFAALGMGNMTQINSISSALHGSFGVPPLWTGIVTALICAVIISGGISRIGAVTEKLIPILSLIYIAAAVFVIFRNFAAVPAAFAEIFRGAFGLNSIGGGISGAVISRSISVGLRRGVFSNEAGLGSSAVMHSSSENRDPQSQGMWAVFEVFADTIICCTLTALVILTTGVSDSEKDGALLVTAAFAEGIGSFADVFISAAIVLFAFATIIGWFHCGECGVTYLCGECGKPFYKTVFIAFIVVGAVAELRDVWTVSDIFNGLMALPNLIGLVILRKKVCFKKNI